MELRLPQSVPACHIRAFREADRELLEGIYRAQEGGAFPIGYSAEFSKALTPGTYLVAELNGQVVGGLGLRLSQFGEIHDCSLFYLMVEPKSQRKGIGRLLLLSSLAVLPPPADSGAWYVHLQALPATRNFYEKLGFGWTRIEYEPRARAELTSLLLMVKTGALQKVEELLHRCGVTIDVRDVPVEPPKTRQSLPDGSAFPRSEGPLEKADVRHLYKRLIDHAVRHGVAAFFCLTGVGTILLGIYGLSLGFALAFLGCAAAGVLILVQIGRASLKLFRETVLLWRTLKRGRRVKLEIRAKKFAGFLYPEESRYILLAFELQDYRQVVFLRRSQMPWPAKNFPSLSFDLIQLMAPDGTLTTEWIHNAAPQAKPRILVRVFQGSDREDYPPHLMCYAGSLETFLIGAEPIEQPDPEPVGEPEPPNSD